MRSLVLDSTWAFPDDDLDRRDCDSRFRVNLRFWPRQSICRDHDSRVSPIGFGQVGSILGFDQVSPFVEAVTVELI